jgi:2-amino-4-hydroxy-6-hydroxymethyldihydropteridine diphosphokinase
MPGPLARCFVGLGSNVGDRRRFLAAAAERLEQTGKGGRRSGIYETVPLGPPQADFLNAVFSFETDLGARALLETMLAIERDLGRVRREKWGPRTIDLDLLAVNGLVIDEPGLEVPHPEIRRRAFVLRPWLDLDPGFVVPGASSVQSLWDALPASERASVRPFSGGWTLSG